MAKKKLDDSRKLFDSRDAAPAMPEGYYCGDKPNPNLRKFVEEHGTPYDPETDQYNVAAFNQPITTTKATAIYNMHSYWSKKPHDAIRQYIRHYTNTGDIVLDPLCGSGGTAVASLLDGRTSIAIDRSPAATFITKVSCTPIEALKLREAYTAVRDKVQAVINWLYETRCDRCNGPATTGYTVYSQVFQCPRCLARLPLFDCPLRQIDSRGKEVYVCPRCLAKGHPEEISTRSESFGAVPVKTVYSCLKGCRPSRGERIHNDHDVTKRKYFNEYDLGKIRDIETKAIPFWYPRHRMMNVEDDHTPWGDKWRAGTSNFRTVAELFTKRNLWAIACMRHAITEEKDINLRDALLFAMTGVLFNCTRMYREREQGRGTAKGNYYVPQLSREMVVTNGFDYKVEQQLVPAFSSMMMNGVSLCVSTQSVCDLTAIPANTVDYIFTDPPYSHTIQYGELNFLWEAWLDFDTTWHDQEIIVNDVRGRTEEDWAAMMKQAMAECYRVLKPGRWLSLCYHDTSEGTWELVQDIMAEVGFVVDKTESALFIETGQKSFNQLTADKATKRDLVLNFRKLKPVPIRVTKVYSLGDADKLPIGSAIATFSDSARQIVRDFLVRHPGSTKDRIYDEMVSRLVSSRSMEAHDFDAILKSVAEQVQEPVMQDLFRNKEPDLWSSHVQSRWYLKETGDQVDHAEQAKEDAATACLTKFVGEYLKKNPELEGVHYSDLFEQYLPVQDKPRRLLADWLVEYFIKTPSGTWRLPDKEEAQQLGRLRKEGTLRRIKRFANALIDGVPVRDNDRPGNDVDLLDWLRQCRRAGLYEQGKAIYEKGGLNSANLTDEQQIQAEDDYRICARRGSTEERKPKRQRRTKEDDDE